jgi:hypothetical protein
MSINKPQLVRQVLKELDIALTEHEGAPCCNNEHIIAQKENYQAANKHVLTTGHGWILIIHLTGWNWIHVMWYEIAIFESMNIVDSLQKDVWAISVALKKLAFGRMGTGDISR